MEDLFAASQKDTFILFSTEHLLSLAAIAFGIVLIIMFREAFRNKVINHIVRLFLIIVLTFSEISLHLWLWFIEAWEIEHSLPFHLSSISLLLSTLLLWTKNYLIFEFTYFAGVGSAIQAMLTPDIKNYSFPHFRYVHFFISHGGIVIANAWMVFVEKFRPTIRSLCKAFLLLNGYTAIIFIVNMIIGGNYMYVTRKPVNPSILDYLGPWPWYIIFLEIITLATFFLLFLPFWIYERKKK